MRIISGKYGSRKLKTLTGNNTRPTEDRVREAVFGRTGPYFDGGIILDLFAGSGALSLEALSRGASYAVLNDVDRNAYSVQRKNITALKYEDRTKQIHSDWHTTLIQLQKENRCFDLVFLDPPYSMTDLTGVFSGLMPLITHHTLIIVEHEAKKQPIVNEQYHVVKNRAWGYCAVTIYQLTDKGA